MRRESTGNTDMGLIEPPIEAPAEPPVERPVDLVRRWIEREGVPAPGEPVVVGCSGGADSSALLLALAACGLGPLHAVYVDHGLRPGETASEAEIVAGVARVAGATSERIAVVVERRGNLLAQARRARYQALAEAARRQGARWVAVGHTATDQAETVVFRAWRGDLQQALAGMPARRVLVDGEGPSGGGIELVRPLLAVKREETEAFVAARGLPIVRDPSNERSEFARVRIRRWLAAQGEASEWLRRSGEVVQAVALYDEAAQGLGTLDDLDATAVAAAGPEVALRLLRRAGLYRAGRVQVEALLRLVSSQQGSRTLDLGSGIVAERCYGRLRLGPPRQDPGDLAIPVTGGGRYPWGVGVVVVTLAEGATVPANLVLRNLRPGDRLRTPAGRRKLHDMLVDRKVPRSLRRRVPLLAVESEVLWVGWPGGGRPGRLAPGAEEPAELAVTYLVSDGNRW